MKLNIKLDKKQLVSIGVAFLAGVAVREGIVRMQQVDVLKAKALDRVSTKRDDIGFPVFVTAAETNSIENTFDTFATMKAWKEINLYPMDKSVVEKVLVGPGDSVNVGSILAVMRSNIQELRRQLSETDLSIQRNEFDLVRSLADKNFVSKKELEQKTLALKSQELRAEIEKVEGNKSVLKSPIKGIVSQINLKVRDYIDDAQKHLVTIVDPTRLKAELFLPQDVAAQLGPKSKIVFSKSGRLGDQREGRIESVDPIVDSKTGTVRTIASLDGQKGWMPGIYAKTSLILSQKNNAVVVPNRALVREGEDMFVYKVDSDESGQMKSLKIPVKIGMSAKDKVEISEGVEEFDNIVTRGQGSLSDGAAVRIIENTTTQKSEGPSND